MVKCNQSTTDDNQIPQKGIRSIILAKFKAGVSKKELFKKELRDFSFNSIRNYNILKYTKERI